jgi:hypothetical protein
MATTPRFGLHYQALTDAPDGAALGALLAADVDALLSKAYVCTSSTRPTGVPDWFLIGETDTGDLLRYNAAGSAWVNLTGATSGGGGGGGGGSTSDAVPGKWRATANQSLPNGTDTVLAFGNTETASSVVTRATAGSGHKFTLAETRVYAVTATVRIIPGATGSRFIELRNSAQTVRYVADGDQGGPAASTRSFSVTDLFTAGTELVVIAAQSSGGTLTTQFQGSSITDGFVRLTIVAL